MIFKVEKYRQTLCFIFFSCLFDNVRLLARSSHTQKPTDHFSFSLNYFHIFVHFSRVSFEYAFARIILSRLCIFRLKNVYFCFFCFPLRLFVVSWNSREKYLIFSLVFLNQFRKAVLWREGKKIKNCAHVSAFRTKIMRLECAHLSFFPFLCRRHLVLSNLFREASSLYYCTRCALDHKTVRVEIMLS
jgi:hypothetical protein